MNKNDLVKLFGKEVLPEYLPIYYKKLTEVTSNTPIKKILKSSFHQGFINVDNFWKPITKMNVGSYEKDKEIL